VTAPSRAGSRLSVAAVRPRPIGRRLEKSAAAFRTISEVATELDVPQHVLRFWETKFPQVRPLKRGGGRRYYRPEDVDLLRSIRRLLYQSGFTIKGVQRLLREGALRDTPESAAPPDGGGKPASAPKDRQLELAIQGGLNARQRAELEGVLRDLLQLRQRLAQILA
jgi:DNA-binding transcriptional MerR regulator